MVRPVLPGEIPRFHQLLAAHHWLGPRLFGPVVRHVAVLGGAWVALLGYGSAVLRCTARDRVIGWADADRVDRLPMLAGNQRFCVLPGSRRPHLASAVLARSLARLPADYLRFRNQIVLAVETFTDPARHTGACYAAAGFACAGSTRGYARRAGGSGCAFHGQVKRCWLREVAPGGLAALGAPAPSGLFTPPPPAVWLDLSRDQVASLRACLDDDRPGRAAGRARRPGADRRLCGRVRPGGAAGVRCPLVAAGRRLRSAVGDQLPPVPARPARRPAGPHAHGWPMLTRPSGRARCSARCR